MSLFTDKELGLWKPSASSKAAEIKKDGACSLSLAVFLWHPASLQRRMKRRVLERGAKDSAPLTVIFKDPLVRDREVAQCIIALALQTRGSEFKPTIPMEKAGCGHSPTETPALWDMETG